MSDEAPQSTAGTKPSREDLDKKAAELGVQEPEKLKNMEAVEEAIADAEAVPRFSRDEVLGNARTLTGYSRNHMIGALHGDDRTTFTKEEATRAGASFGRHKQEVG